MFAIGQTFSKKRILSQQDFDLFAQLSGDDNPIHVDPEFASHTRFGRPVAHGMMLYGLICGLLGESFPGAVQAEQEMMFPAPTFAGKEITILVEVIEIEGNQLTAATTISDKTGKLTCDGQTRLLWEKV